MNLSQIANKVKISYKAQEWFDCASWAMTAVFSTSGLSWPYFYLGECHYNLGNMDLSKSFYRLYLLRRKESDPVEWTLKAKSRYQT